MEEIDATTISSTVTFDTGTPTVTMRNKGRVQATNMKNPNKDQGKAKRQDRKLNFQISRNSKNFLTEVEEK